MTNINPSKLVEFIDKTFSIKQNAVYGARDFTKLLSEAAGYNTYAETVKSDALTDADNLYYRIKADTDIQNLLESFIKLTDKQARRLKGRKAVVILDYTYEPYFGSGWSIWTHEYKPVNGCRGCYKMLAASVLADEQRFFVYAKPVSLMDNETEEIELALGCIRHLKIGIKVVLLDRGFTKSSRNLGLLNSKNIRYLGLYPKYRNIKTIIKETKRNFINRMFRVKNVKTRLVIGKQKIVWVFVTNLERKDFFTYLKLYKKRWNIETGFRVQDEAQIKTKSTDVRIRYFLFLISMILYNSWKSMKICIPFKRFVIEFQKICGGVVNEFKQIDPG